MCRTWHASESWTPCPGYWRRRPRKPPDCSISADLAAPFQLSRPTIQDYVALLERVFLLERLPAWSANRLSRLVHAPKLHLCDTGLICALLGVDSTTLYTDRTLMGTANGDVCVSGIAAAGGMERDASAVFPLPG